MLGHSNSWPEQVLGRFNSVLTPWHMEGKALPCSGVPLAAVLKESRQLAGIRGCRTHRPTMPPHYDFKVRVELDSSDSAEAPPPRLRGTSPGSGTTLTDAQGGVRTAQGRC